MKITLYTADTVGNPKNCKYPHEKVIEDPDALAEAVVSDNVCGRFKDDYRSGDNFISCNCIMMDNDNDHSEEESDWVSPEQFAAELPDVQMAIVPSRNNMKPKNGKPPRPKYHVIFPIKESEDPKYIAGLKQSIQRRFPFFDGNALDAARFVFGAPCSKDEVLWQDGWETIEDYIEVSDAVDELEDMLPMKPLGVIPNGQRNKTLNLFAGKILKRYGDCERAYQIYLEEAKKCETPLSEFELKNIYKSALKFYKEKVVKQDGYVAPIDYNDPNKQPGYLKPDDFSDIGEAKVLVKEYGAELLYTPATGYMRYDGRVWVESKQKAVGAMEEFLDLQYYDAMILLAERKKACIDAGIDVNDKKAALSDEEAKLLAEFVEAKLYFNFVLKRRDMKYVMSTLQAAMPMLEVAIDDLDGDPYLLNTPIGTIDLRVGLSSLREHDPNDHITKITQLAPSDDGKEEWLDQLDRTFLGNAETIEYTQKLLGEAIFGYVQNERMTIAHGQGRNGKSTVCNACAAVLGTYSGSISAETLTIGCKRNVKPEIAEIKGKRLLIAGELEENQRLSTSVVKQLCSTDRIVGEKKYKDPFSFVPSHSLILYTNHLPKVGGTDEGIWRRLVVIPFYATFVGEGDILNYTNVLVEHGGYILKWLIEGAKKAYDANFKVTVPAEVQEAINKYRNDNDWFAHFLEECCEVDASFEEKSGDLYSSYRAYCARVNEYARSTTEFYNVLSSRGFEQHRSKSGRTIKGLKLADLEAEL